MIISRAKNTVLINKDVIYNDLVLSTDKTNANLVITCVDGINQELLEECINIIMESNSDIIFDSIQYSKRNNKVYFYTFKEISTREWDRVNKVKYTKIINSADIINEINKVKLCELDKDKNNISLYDLGMIYKEMFNEYNQVKQKYNRILGQGVKKFYSNYSLIFIDEFNYDLSTLKLIFKASSNSSFSEIVFAKNGDDLYIVSSTSIHVLELLILLGDEISQVFNELKYFSEYKKSSNKTINSINSLFQVNLENDKMDVFLRDGEFNIIVYSYNDKYKIDSNSYNIVKLIKDNEDEFLKKIIIKIEDCPEWCQVFLYYIKEMQLTRFRQLEHQNKNYKGKIKVLTKKIMDNSKKTRFL